MKISYILTERNLVIHILSETKPRILTGKSKEYYNEVIQNIAKVKAGTLSLNDFIESITPAKMIEHKSDGRFVFCQDQLFLKTNQDVSIPDTLSKRIVTFLDEELPVDALVNFWTNCLENPEYRAVLELYDFLESGHFPITDDGCFLAYKKVTMLPNQEGIPDSFKGLFVDDKGFVRNYNNQFVSKDLRLEYLNWVSSNQPKLVDSHSKTMDNSIGKIVKMPREHVNPNRDQTCSTGLHFANIEYASGFSGNTMIMLKINPRDVVSIPSDYSNQKGRCCQYEVIGYAEGIQIESQYVNTAGNMDDLDLGFEEDEEYEEEYDTEY